MVGEPGKQAIPKRTYGALAYRKLLEFLEPHLPLPEISASFYHPIGIGFSLMTIWAQHPWTKAFLTAVALLLDWIDGATARRYHQVSMSGYYEDIFTDRLSEGIIFYGERRHLAGRIFIGLWIVNLALVFYSMRRKIHFSLPLRILYLFVFLFRGIFH